MDEKHTRTLTSTLLKPSDSETGNGERFAVWTRRLHAELRRATARLRPCTPLVGPRCAVPGLRRCRLGIGVDVLHRLATACISPRPHRKKKKKKKLARPYLLTHQTAIINPPIVCTRPCLLHRGLAGVSRLAPRLVTSTTSRQARRCLEPVPPARPTLALALDLRRRSLGSCETDRATPTNAPFTPSTTTTSAHSPRPAPAAAARHLHRPRTLRRHTQSRSPRPSNSSRLSARSLASSSSHVVRSSMR